MKKTRPLTLALAAALTVSLTASGVADAQIGPRGKMRERMMQRLQEKKAEEERPIDLQAILPGARKLTAAYGADPAQAVDIYIPPNVPRDAPVIVMVHGGAWKIGDKANTGSVENKLRHWLPKGFVFASVNYRMLPQAMAYTQAQDVAAALRWTRSHAADWGASDRNIILMGHSAGAHLVALLSSKPAMVGHPWAGTVVLDSATMKVSETMVGRHPKFYDEAFGGDPAGWAKASPMDQWTPSAVQMMLICSTKRPDKPCDDARAFQALAKRSGVRMPVLPQPLTHADVNRTLGLPGDYTDAVDRFIAERLRR
ncbi:alpha/beta hydrolase [Caulobacter sp. BP25]|uniref:alpha/beta hydrolase n=1 Tax=Caulobacter sp. BP25 TaxID=2048900 RepID=UPI000C12C2B5|nr:alpha/beta hydrolase [Caulobacter sp. BP25]PHY19933.1 esterase [Caulobacter sp. BP25]